VAGAVVCGMTVLWALFTRNVIHWSDPLLPREILGSFFLIGHVILGAVLASNPVVWPDARGAKFPFVTLLVPCLLATLVALPFLSFRCVVEGTLVSTPTGPRAIETIRPGDMVWTRSIRGTIEPALVVRVRVDAAREHLRIRLDDGRLLRVTEMHPIARAGGYVPAGRLLPRALVVTETGTAAVAAIERASGRVLVYELTVEPNANFFAAGVLVHNKSGVGGIARNASGSLMWMRHIQDTYRASDSDGDGRSEYWVDDIAGLCFRPAAGSPLPLRFIEISMAMADGSPAAPLPNGVSSSPGAGYWFFALSNYEAEDGTLVPYSTAKASHWGAIAVPNGYGSSGRHVYILNQDGVMYRKDPEWSAPNSPRAR
jgi:hypothetical protein